MFSKRWVPHEIDVFELVDVVCEDEVTGELTVTNKDGVPRQVAKADAKIADETHLRDFDDLCFMNNLHEAPMLYMLRCRHAGDKIYTNTGNILISLNPYKHIPGLYDSPLDFFQMLDDDEEEQIESATELPQPHAYVIANSALKILASSAEDADGPSKRFSLSAVANIPLNQSIVVSGESGAGKTEASKHVMNFLIVANDFMCGQGAKSNRNLLEIGEKIKNVLVESNVILEAFGNAKTVQNDNSSRFGKYIRLQYTSDNQLTSAYTETFLLEKSRLVTIGKDERNYHVFYQLIRGLNVFNSSLASKINLSNLNEFSILTEGGCTVVGSEQKDIADFEELCNALSVLGCSSEEVLAIWNVLAAILHLGEVRVVSSPTDPDNIPCVLEGRTMAVDGISELLGVVGQELSFSITTHQMQAGRRGSVHIKVLTAIDTKNNIYALIKWLYRSLFSWLIRKVNYAHCSVCGQSRKVSKFIGILDIFGFEILGVNSFEQLCINFTNERLQQQFNEHVFVLEQKDYAKEGLEWNSITFKDNQHVIDLISKKPLGLLTILEEHGMMNRKPDDGALLAAYNQAHEKSVQSYSKTRFAGVSFIVKHFAGDVVYSIDGFLNKNNNCMQDDLQSVINRTESVFMQNIIGSLVSFQGDSSSSAQNRGLGFIPDIVAESGPSPMVGSSVAAATPAKKMASADTVSFQFRNQLDQLIGTLRSTHPHYIKCIKTNSLKRPGIFEAPLVLKQLRYSGALEVVRIRREGYPTRMPFVDFYDECWLLAEKGWQRPKHCDEALAKQYSIGIAGAFLDKNKFQAGNSMIFLTDGCLFTLHKAILGIMSNASTKLQGWYRRLSCLFSYSKARLAVRRAQKYIRKFIRRCRSLKELTMRRMLKEKQEREVRERLAREAEELRLRLEREAEELRQRLEKEALERKIRLEREEKERQAEAERIAVLEATKAAAELLRLEEEAKLLEEERRQKELAEKERQKWEWEELRRREEQLHVQKQRAHASSILCARFSHIFEKRKYIMRVRNTFAACQDGKESLVMDAISAVPSICFARLNSMSLLQVAIISGHNSLVGKLFQIAFSQYPKYALHHLKFCWERKDLLALLKMSQLIVSQSRVSDVIFSKEEHTSRVCQIMESWIARADSMKELSYLFSGYLEKKRGKNDWKRRWCVVTQSDILYFINEGDLIPKGTVPLFGCSIRRYPNDKQTFEVISPNIVVKKTFFGKEKVKAMLFRADSEEEYNRWLTVLRAVTNSIPITHSQCTSREVCSTIIESAPNTDFSSSGCTTSVGYWKRCCESSTENLFWSNADETRSLPFLLGYTYIRVTAFFADGSDVSGISSLTIGIEHKLTKNLFFSHNLAPEYSSSNSIVFHKSVILHVPVENMDEDYSVKFMLANISGSAIVSAIEKCDLCGGMHELQFVVDKCCVCRLVCFMEFLRSL